MFHPPFNEANVHCGRCIIIYTKIYKILLSFGYHSRRDNVENERKEEWKFAKRFSLFPV